MILLPCLRNVLLLSDVRGERVYFEIFRLLHSFSDLAHVKES